MLISENKQLKKKVDSYKKGQKEDQAAVKALKK